MGGGVAMRVAGKIAGVVNGFRGVFPALPGNMASAAFRASATRPITGVISSSDTQYDATDSTVTKPLIEFENWALAEEVASSIDVGQPLPRVVFGGPPTLEEAADVTSQLRTALDQAYLSKESCEGSYVSDMGHNKLAISDSGHLESKACVNKASGPESAIKAFRLLRESAAVQTAVASIASDSNVWFAVMNNEALREFVESHKTGMNGSFEELSADAEIPGYQEYSDNEKEQNNGFNNLFENIKLRLEDIMNSLSGFIQNLFDGPAGAGGSGRGPGAGGNGRGPGAGGVCSSIMGLAIMVIMVVVLKRV